jgi:hypothetical protein
MFREVLGSKFGPITRQLEVLPDFHQSLQVNVETVPRLSNGRFHQHRFQFIIHEPSNHLALHSLDTESVVNQLTKRLRHTSSGYSLVSHRGGPGSSPGLVKWELWTKWRWGRFSPSTSVSPANLHHTKFSILTITRGRYNGPISGRRAEWTQFRLHPPYANLTN